MFWNITDFKGILSAELDIHPGMLTVLTGVNSSGKSSIIQSLLLLAQSLHRQGPIVLNGPLVRLGHAQDLVREESESGAIRIRMRTKLRAFEDEKSEQEIGASFDLASAEGGTTLRVRKFEVAFSGNEQHPLIAAREYTRAEDAELAMQITAPFGPRDVLHLKSLIGSDRRQLRTYVVMKGLQLTAFVELSNENTIANRYRAAFEAQVFGSRKQKQASESFSAKYQVPIAFYIREFVRLLTRTESNHPENEQALIERVSAARNGNPYVFEGIWESLDQSDREKLIEIAALSRSRTPYVILPIETRFQKVGLLESQLESQLGQSYAVAEGLIDELNALASQVEYLGPLRDEPRVVWDQWNELARGLPVGARGEYSAAVLNRSGGQLIHYGLPESKELGIETLATAVDRWLSYLEIGEAVSARPHGKLGVGLDLQIGGHFRDLTSVGVGVSQALPLLVGVLAAPAGSIFIVEQPELHLHPDVQSRLADFMLTARPDMALIVETHSDSFITRIRRRAAEGSINIDNVDITFVEPSHRGSVSRSLEVSEFGDLSEWPKGFVSSVEEDVRAILEANVARQVGDIDGKSTAIPT